MISSLQQSSLALRSSKQQQQPASKVIDNWQELFKAHEKKVKLTQQSNDSLNLKKTPLHRNTNTSSSQSQIQQIQTSSIGAVVFQNKSDVQSIVSNHVRRRIASRNNNTARLHTKSTLPLFFQTDRMNTDPSPAKTWTKNASIQNSQKMASFSDQIQQQPSIQDMNDKQQEVELQSKPLKFIRLPLGNVESIPKNPKKPQSQDFKNTNSLDLNTFRQHKEGNQLVSTRDVEQMILLRKEQRKKQNGERDNFYLQLLSNESKMRLNPKENVLRGKQNEENNGMGVSSIFGKSWRIEDDDNISTEEYLQSMKLKTEEILKNSQIQYHNSQNHEMRRLDERSDIKSIDEWMRLKIQGIYENNHNNSKSTNSKVQKSTTAFMKPSQLFESLSDILEVVLLELCKQIEVECSERSQLLRRIWDLHGQLNSQWIYHMSKNNLRTQTQQLQQNNRVHKAYLDDINRLNAASKGFTDTLEVKDNYMNKIKSENRYLRKKCRRLEQTSELLANHLQLQMTEQTELLKENDVQQQPRYRLLEKD